MDKKIAVIFKNIEDKKKCDIFFAENISNFENYQSFLINEFEAHNFYKISIELKLKNFDGFIYFESFEKGFDYYQIRKHKIIKIDRIDLNLYFIFKNKEKFFFDYKDKNKLFIVYKKAIEKNKNFIKSDIKNNKDVLIVGENIFRRESFSFEFSKLNLLNDFADLSKFKKYIFDNIGFYNVNKREWIKIDSNYFDEFLQKVNNDFFDGKNNNLKIKLIKKSEDQEKVYYDFSHNYGKFLIIKDKNKQNYQFEVNFYLKYKVEVLNSKNKLKSIISKHSNPFQRKKISTKKLLLITASFIILAVTLWLTFGFLYEGSYDNVFDILGAGTDTFWFYLLIINFFVSIFFSMALMLLFNYIEKKKFNWKTAFKWFIAAQIRFFVLGLTGNHILSIFFYTLYMNKAIKIPKPKIGGIIGAGFIFRGMIHLLSGIIFVTIGFIYLFSFNIDSFNMNYYTYIILGLSLGGLFFSTGFSIISGLAIINTRIHNIYLYFNLKYNLIFHKNKDYFQLYNSIENKSYELKKSSKNWLKNKKLLIRTALVIFLFFIFEAIETMAAYDLTVNYVNTELIPNNIDQIVIHFPNIDIDTIPLDIKYNFVEFAGLRSIVKNANDFFPFIPFGYVEYMVNGLYQILLWQNIYQIAEINNIPFTPDTWGINVNSFIDTFSASTTFITMFFGKYMRLIFSLFIFVYFIFYEFVWKLLKNNSL